MKHTARPVLSLFLFLTVLHYTGFAQSPSKPVYVIVHGAWGGGWAFKKVDSMLTARGANVYRVTLTGQGERVHLASTTVGLQTHVLDVVNTILFEDLHDIILVGHSYGGMVITGVADSLAGRIRKLVYVDAMFPSNGLSVAALTGNDPNKLKAGAPDGFIPPYWLKPGTPLPHDVPHQVKTLTDTLWLKHGESTLPTTYILTVAKGVDPAKDDFAAQAERARKRKGIKMLQLEADHNPQWSAPAELVAMLYEERN